jgi:hypothetical protein
MLTQEMNALAREIATAQDARMAAMAKLRKSSRAERDARMAAMAKLRRVLRAELGRVRPELAKSEAARAAGVKTWIRTATADRVGAHEAWRDLTVTLHGKRVAAAASAKKPATPVAPVEPAPVAKAQ